MDDTELLTRCLAGDRPAWDRLVREHAGVMYAVVARMLARGSGPQPGAEDVLQAVFLKLWEDDRRRLGTFRGGCRLGTWLVAVARREALDRLRRRDRRERHERALQERGHGMAAACEAPDARLAGREEQQRLTAALGRIPARDRLLVQLVGEDGWTYRSVARVLGLRENSVGPLLARARQRLASALAPESQG